MPFMSKVLVCDRLFSRKVLDFFRFVSNNHNSHRIFLSNMCPFLVAVGVITVDPSKSGAGFYWGGSTVEQNEHPKDQFLCQISRKKWAYVPACSPTRW